MDVELRHKKLLGICTEGIQKSAQRQESDLARIHGKDERIGVENYGEVVRFFEQLMRNGAGQGPLPTPPKG
jgi:hypothetical protein